MDPQSALAALAWQVELGADEAILDAPINRYALSAEAPRPAKQAAPSAPSASALPVAPAAPASESDPVMLAREAADVASLEALSQALANFPHCELKKGARSCVFSDGQAGAPVMIIGEAPGRDEDIQGKPFVGRAGQLLDRMLAAIGRDRAQADPAQAVYISNILPWRPPQNRDPKPDEIAMMLPFMERHVALADPKLIVLMGNIACQAMLGKRGITRLRGSWTEVLGRPALPMFHPAYLLRNPHAKREAWADLLALQARLREV
jgi:DNA polymerase